MQELSLNILDIAQNCIAAQANLIEITVEINEDRWLMITITDNGCGMSDAQLQQVTNPFFTSRTTRKVGLGIPLFAQACTLCGGTFSIRSNLGQGTKVSASFDTNHIDCMPLGEIEDTIAILIQMNPEIDFVYTAKQASQAFVCDTRQLKQLMEGMPLSDFTVVQWIKEFIRENQFEIFKRRY